MSGIKFPNEQLYILSDPDYYDVPWAPGSPLLDSEFDPDGSRASSSWSSDISGPWINYLPPGGSVPRQGWKVHVSALPDDAATVIDLCREIVADRGIAYKTLRSAGLVLATQLKTVDPTGAGKVVVCYPRRDQLEDLCLALASALGDRPCPDVFGELQVPHSPVFLRYGAFGALPLIGPDGEVSWGLQYGNDLVPDVRGRVGTDPEGDPGFIASLKEARSQTQEGQRLEVSQVSLLHRSNGGGVYAATDAQGRAVVLKEARQNAGLDLAKVPATVRLRHEYDALKRLSGTGIAPEPYDYLELSSSDFLVMSRVPGRGLFGAFSSSYPPFFADAPDEQYQEYRAWMAEVLDGLRRSVRVLKEHGIIHGDLQPANVMVDGSQVRLIDFESCSIDGRSVTRGVATQAFSPGIDSSIEGADDFSVKRIGLFLTSPQAMVLGRRPELEDDVRRIGRAALAREPMGSLENEPEVVRGLIRGIARAATPEREDRLFPGDPEQFEQPTGGLGLLYGAAGVLLALRELGAEYDPAWDRWLAERSRHIVLQPGFGAGIHGITHALALTGNPEPAEALIDRWLESYGDAEHALPPWWQTGQAGLILAYRGLAATLGRRDLAERSDALTRALVRTITRASTAELPGYAPGLQTGWAGVGLSLLRACPDDPEIADVARRTLRLEAERFAWHGDSLLAAVDGADRPYLGIGSAASGLLAATLLTSSQTDADFGVTDDQGQSLTLGAVHRGVAEACHGELAAFIGLMSGQAGLALAEALLASDPATEEPDVDKLAAQEPSVKLPAQSGLFLEESDGSIYALGDQNHRRSTDLACGSAGVALAISRPTAAMNLLLPAT